MVFCSGVRVWYEMDVILLVCDGKRFVIIDSGFVVVVLGNVEVDDVVWVLDWVRMLFVCRRIGFGEVNGVRFIGIFFFFGIMELEVMKEYVSDVWVKVEVMRWVEELVVE